MTSGCTVEACDFRDAYSDFSELNAVVIGVSKDSGKSHQKFIDKHELPFLLLSDEDTKINQKYGVWKEKNYVRQKVFWNGKNDFCD